MRHAESTLAHVHPEMTIVIDGIVQTIPGEAMGMLTSFALEDMGLDRHQAGMFYGERGPVWVSPEAIAAIDDALWSIDVSGCLDDGDADAEAIAMGQL